MTSPTAGSQRAADADNAEAFDELAKDEETEATLWDPDEGPATAPDLGMFAVCLALCAAGCATAASCRGHPGADAWSRKLVILFTADVARARLVEEIARAIGCGLATTDNAKLSLRAVDRGDARVRGADHRAAHGLRRPAAPVDTRRGAPRPCSGYARATTRLGNAVLTYIASGVPNFTLEPPPPSPPSMCRRPAYPECVLGNGSTAR